VVYYAFVAWQKAGGARRLIVPGLGVWLLALALVSHSRAQSWRSPATLMESLARHHPDSYRSVVGYAFNSIPASVDLSVRFDAFKRAAALDDRVVVPLIEMAKIATALDRFTGGGEQGLHPLNEGGDKMPINDMMLLADRGHNARLLAALDSEINQRVASKSVRIDSVVALIALVDCALNGNIECISLRLNTRRWHDSALSNERLSGEFRAVLELSVAKFLASAGEYDSAVRHAQRAGELAADNLEYRLQEAILYALLGRWDELLMVLDEAEYRFPDRANADSRFQDLRRQYDSASNNVTPTPK
jgi:tetratricopeptide (TPR) repeat protein